jgi:hypothetical protein
VIRKKDRKTEREKDRETDRKIQLTLLNVIMVNFISRIM